MDTKTKLFAAVERGQTGNINTFLDQGAPINARDPKIRDTPLIQAARLRNFVVQKLLLARGANPKLKNADGLTALHYVSSNGDEESVKLLLAHGAALDAVDKQGCAPLHYAVNKNNVETVKILLFCGADAFLKDKLGRTPYSLEEDPSMQHILKTSKLSLHGIQNRGILLQHKQIHAGQIYHLDTLGIHVHVQTHLGTEVISFLCKRTRPEYSDPRLKPTRKELLISEAFEYIVSVSTKECVVTMDIPLYGPPNTYEEVVMKTVDRPSTDGKPALTNIRRSDSGDKWLCRIDVVNSGGFVLVTRPKVETVEVGHDPVHFVSAVDEKITLDIPENTYEEPGAASLEVIPGSSCSADDEEDDACENLLSVGNLYQINHSSSKVPKQDITFTVPVPNDYTGKGELVLLVTSLPDSWFSGLVIHNEEDDVDDETVSEELVQDNSAMGNWEMVEDNVMVKDGKIYSLIRHCSIYVPMEVRKATPLDEIKLLADEVCKRSCIREKFVVFFTMTKDIAEDTFSIVVECTESKNVNKRADYWRSHGYKDQLPEGESGVISAVPAAEFTLTVPDDVDAKITSERTLPLQFHPNRRSYQNFELKVGNFKRTSRRCVVVIKQKGRKGGEEEIIYQTQVTSVLRRPMFVKNTVENKRRGLLETFIFQITGIRTPFINNAFVNKYARDLGDEWITVGILLGLSYKTMESIADNKKKDLEKKKREMLRRWKDWNKDQDDHHGLPDLLYALREASREDLSEQVHHDLRHWFNNYVNTEDPFHKWLKSAFSCPEEFEKQGRVEPQSDEFLALLVEKCEDNLWQIGPDLDLPPDDLEMIQTNIVDKDSRYGLLKMLVTARERHANKVQFLQILQRALQSLNQPGILRWFNDAAKDWLHREQEEQHQMRPDSNEENVFLTEPSANLHTILE